ncbi:unnamed protein product [Ilex paraguariensis]|uniref:Uncharacterized protein n=1 Tax=Ilex paraguariensis TaxID=185542 RepID=A0ABC8TG46_9AQUA
MVVEVVQKRKPEGGGKGEEGHVGYSLLSLMWKQGCTIGCSSGVKKYFQVCYSIWDAKYAMQQAFKTLMGQMNTQNNQFSNAAFSPGSPFPYPSPPASGPTASSAPAASQPVTVDVSATKVEAAPTTHVKDHKESEKGPKKYGTSGLFLHFFNVYVKKSTMATRGLLLYLDH